MLLKSKDAVHANLLDNKLNIISTVKGLNLGSGLAEEYAKDTSGVP